MKRKIPKPLNRTCSLRKHVKIILRKYIFGFKIRMEDTGYRDIFSKGTKNTWFLCQRVTLSSKSSQGETIKINTALTLH